MKSRSVLASGCCCSPGSRKLAADETSYRVDTAAVRRACPHLPSCLKSPELVREVLLLKDQLEINGPSYTIWGWWCVRREVRGENLCRSARTSVLSIARIEAVVCLASSQARLASRTLYFLPYLVTQSRLTALNDWS